MKAQVAIIAALPREVKALVEGWERREPAANVFVYLGRDAVVACAGMGAARVELAVRAAMEALQVTALISAGLAGACDADLKVGDIVRAGVVVDELTGERFGRSEPRPVLVSADGIANAEAKARLRASLGADAVDMEAARVARIAQQHGLEFRAIKAISDEADFAMDGLMEFVTADGQFNETAFARHVAARPAQWGKAIALGRNSSRALDALTVVLEAELDWYRQQA